MTMVSEEMLAELRDVDLQTEIYFRDVDGELIPLQVRWRETITGPSIMLLERKGSE